ncbi:GIY-YIG nuclease family protein [Allosphingosinicella vermicomposti]|uniref:GIY-YIG nuclease family protein n=1 Tax=Allosphingosinicella vermicomposti TaxID=614671 RepID=UPI000D0E90EF|nr:GIY-YIG nuclease family protein [Allosphingosinicella vermicomposti]
MERLPIVYILASGRRGTLYIGVTSDLIRRIHEHRAGERSGFVSRYSAYRLVYHETHQTMPDAIAREKQLKNWHRAWKLNLIEEKNPHWEDLAIGLGFAPLPPAPHRPYA